MLILTIGDIIGITGGIMVNSEGLYPYFGFGLISPPGGVAITYSPYDPSPGGNVAIQGGYGLGGQRGAGNLGKGKEARYWEGGVVTPGISITVFRVWEVKWPWN